MRMGLKHKRQLQQAAEQLGQNGCPDERILGIEIREVRKVAEAAGRREIFRGRVRRGGLNRFYGKNGGKLVGKDEGLGIIY